MRAQLGTNDNRFLRGAGECVSLGGGGRKLVPARKFSSELNLKGGAGTLLYRLFFRSS